MPSSLGWQLEFLSSLCGRQLPAWARVSYAALISPRDCPYPRALSAMMEPDQRAEPAAAVRSSPPRYAQSLQAYIARLPTTAVL